MQDLELKIFQLLTEYETETIVDQKALCKEITALFPKPNLTKYALKAIIEQLKMCKYACEGGPLENNTAFIALCELAE